MAVHGCSQSTCGGPTSTIILSACYPAAQTPELKIILMTKKFLKLPSTDALRRSDNDSSGECQAPRWDPLFFSALGGCLLSDSCP
jgi:hypothetical protein